ncbi:hypothetical protein BAZ12_11315 [Elizabethkingia miricola]|uniref:Uncharacterized protein n=1 Tax=Elizabethkingia miricola TaxID=172045 RepID=A0ABD4DNN7_ELIMR|nr:MULTISPECIES: hypothetical protein [Elizabethkingia]KUY20541.1 hypothetical protein ATB95_06450 [Elizabethkingia miricola]MCL1653271.1 hypothetical protein [Elizabethkingia miricola]OPC70365.1 hypothetical protein BAZ12_11315 [Elizabethkingia miricola]OPC74294.1 hypothetical protein BAZ13_04585 [Elizabethkingia miricola]QCO45217.1 hypothetical protein FCS00_02080 [Elizabethkingia sp. 2-6]
MDIPNNNIPGQEPKSGESSSEQKLKKDYIPPRLNVTILTHEKEIIPTSLGNSINPDTENNKPLESDK